MVERPEWVPTTAEVGGFTVAIAVVKATAHRVQSVQIQRSQRVVKFYEPMMEQESYDQKLSQIEHLQSESDDPIVLRFNTGGGQHSGILPLCDAITESNCHVVGLVTGRCHSAGIYFLLACDYKMGYQHGTFLFHPPSCHVTGANVTTYNEAGKRVKSRLTELEAITNRSINYVLQRTRGTDVTRSKIVNYWKDEGKCETVFNSDQAMTHWHFLDEIFHIGNDV